MQRRRRFVEGFDEDDAALIFHPADLKAGRAEFALGVLRPSHSLKLCDFEFAGAHGTGVTDRMRFGGFPQKFDLEPHDARIMRERDASGVSLRMYAVTTLGFVCWTAYGALSGSWPVTVSNGICLVLVITVLALRLKFGDGEGAASPSR